MDFRHLRYFIAVAEERHFTRAAERVGIQQPPLSMQIRQLEEEMGTPLFQRLTRGVALTEAGEAFLIEARAILARVEQARQQVQRLSRGEAGQLRIGFAGATYFQPLVPALLRDFRARYPGVELRPVESNTAQLIDGLMGGEVDLAFVRAPFDAPAGLRSLELVDDELLVALPASHPAAAGADIALAELAQETFILFPRDISPGLYDRMIATIQQAGFSPKLGQEAPQIVSTVPMVAAGFGIALVPASVRQIQTDSVRYLPLCGQQARAPICLAYRQDHASAALANFVALASGEHSSG
ncbi:LysR substrate-binding domain-containing protein [Vogesella sp. LIG4]|uniref:LysR substrate-binding domain-containing protein n=1 Tax=Vogesella sp. LIG4 TaxID=1192162 RepID=UPI00081FF696|nr:LysR substrate-binding domain-containing protein [Vogesella sp. LIG4]SCK19902.1 DNA-binding transcriptional regulator, LysR family [Vogesella sp. LIG4]